MSTAVRDTPLRPSRGADERPGLTTLVQVELRKMIDTRAGFWRASGGWEARDR